MGNPHRNDIRWNRLITSRINRRKSESIQVTRLNGIPIDCLNHRMLNCLDHLKIGNTIHTPVKPVLQHIRFRVSVPGYFQRIRLCI